MTTCGHSTLNPAVTSGYASARGLKSQFDTPGLPPNGPESVGIGRDETTFGLATRSGAG